MKQPQSNGLFEVATSKPNQEKGFSCMKLIEFLTTEGVSDWNEWHNAHLLAASGKCAYAKRCPIYTKTLLKIKENNCKYI